MSGSIFRRHGMPGMSLCHPFVKLLPLFYPKGFGQQFRHMCGMDRREMLDLVAATGAGGDHDGSRRSAMDFGDQRFGDSQGEIVFRLQRSKAPAIPQQPVSSNVTLRPGSRWASRVMAGEPAVEAFRGIGRQRPSALPSKRGEESAGTVYYHPSFTSR